MTKFIPTGDRVLLSLDAPETTSKGGILLPPVAQEKSLIGTVREIGPGKMTERGVWVEPRLSVGDKVMFGKYAGTEIKVDGEDFLVVSTDDIIGVVKP